MTLVTLICSKCGKEFERPLKTHNRNLRLGYTTAQCSATCQVEHLRPKPCEHCGNTTTNPRFCSSRCNALATSKFKPKRPKLGHCRVCGDSISSQRVYCKTCRKLAVSNSKDWSGVTLGELRIKRKANGDATVWAHAKRVFFASPLPKECWICGYFKHIDVCHIKPVAGFADATLICEINNLKNLMGLCRNHHWEFDHGQLSKEDKEKLVLPVGFEPTSCSNLELNRL